MVQLEGLEVEEVLVDQTGQEVQVPVLLAVVLLAVVAVVLMEVQQVLDQLVVQVLVVVMVEQAVLLLQQGLSELIGHKHLMEPQPVQVEVEEVLMLDQDYLAPQADSMVVGQVQVHYQAVIVLVPKVSSYSHIMQETYHTNQEQDSIQKTQTPVTHKTSVSATSLSHTYSMCIQT
jgi:hypothetical protein